MEPFIGDGKSADAAGAPDIRWRVTMIMAGSGSAKVTLHPALGGLPGGDALQSLVNGLGAWALVAAMVGLVVGAAAWALGAHAQNYQQTMVGRRAVLVSGLAALLIGAAPAIINFFYGAGLTVH